MSRRAQFSKWVNKIAGDWGSPKPTTTAGSATRAGDIIWGIFVLVVLGLAVLLAWLLPESKAQYAIAILLGAAIGGSMLFWIPDKVLITAVGGVLGVFLSDLTGAADMVRKAAAPIKEIVALLNEAGAGDITIRPLAGWLILAIILFFCLPAYRSEPQQAGSRVDEDAQADQAARSRDNHLAADATRPR